VQSARKTSPHPIARFPLFTHLSCRFIFASVAGKGLIRPRAASSLGWFAKHDGNIVGGALLGAGMTLTGACPGTIFAQIGAGMPTSVPTLLGGLLGGIAYVRVAPYIRRACSSPAAAGGEPDKLTVAAKLNASPDIVLLCFEALLATMFTFFSQRHASPDYLLPPVFGGVAIGIAQATSLLLAGQPLGTSGSFEEVGEWTWRLVDTIRGKPVPEKPPATTSIQFVSGIALGAFALLRAYPVFNSSPSVEIPALTGFLGGLIMVFGSRVAGGCTSGHGLSGMSMFSVASIVSVVSMFGGGIGLGLLLRSLNA
jgi:uncharacterized membrane protein YedE/YeeE